MTPSPIRVLFLGKQNDPLCHHAADYLTLHLPGSRIHFGTRNDPLPPFPEEPVSLLISYLSPWIIPASWLERVQGPCLNFHPGSPDYPGIGCTNFALYEGATWYGATCHQMEPRVDTGAIVRQTRFLVHEGETVLSLTRRSYLALAGLFYQMMDDVLCGRPLPQSGTKWSRRPFTRADLQRLCQLTPEMDQAEVQRRIRATTYPGTPCASYEPTA